MDGVLVIRTQDRRMVGADESTEVWQPPVVVQKLKMLCTILILDVASYLTI